MQLSTDRIITTHTGSLPRPTAILGAGDKVGTAALRDAVREVVGKQRDAGIDSVSDGELSKPSYATYVTGRLRGFGGEFHRRRAHTDRLDFPQWASQYASTIDSVLPGCVGEVAAVSDEAVHTDIAHLQAALAENDLGEGFITAASPGVIAMFLENHYYPSHESYVRALGEAMKSEYEAVHRSGLILQLDCPDLAAGRHVQFSDLTARDWIELAELHVDVLNEATRNIPPSAMRIHVCWGNYEGPHTKDVPLREIISVLVGARPAALSFEAANPRHEHEWELFRDVKLPDDKIIIPGVIDSTTNYVEHPELVSQRITRFADLVGRDRVIAGVDCGFATFADVTRVAPDVAYAKLASLARGAELASKHLWRNE